MLSTNYIMSILFGITVVTKQQEILIRIEEYLVLSQGKDPGNEVADYPPIKQAQDGRDERE